jgi:hypothetical protein
LLARDELVTLYLVRSDTIVVALEREIEEAREGGEPLSDSRGKLR